MTKGGMGAYRGAPNSRTEWFVAGPRTLVSVVRTERLCPLWIRPGVTESAEVRWTSAYESLAWR